MSKERVSNGCQICDQETDTYNMLPFSAEVEGRDVWLACDGCTEQLGYFCPEHERPHMAFQDGTSACKICIDERVGKEGEVVAESFFGTLESSPERGQIMTDLHEWGLFVSELKGESPARSVARAIITLSERTRSSVDEIVNFNLPRRRKCSFTVACRFKT